MIHWIETQPDINVPDAEYLRLLGFPADYELTGRSRDLAIQAREWYSKNGKPWIYVKQAAAVETSNGKVAIDSIEFSSEKIHDQFVAADADQVVLAAVSAGKACEQRAQQLWQEEKPDEYFFLEVFGSAVVEHLITTVGGKLCDWAEQQLMAVLPHYSPGYPGWQIEDQAQLLNIIQGKAAEDLPGEIQVLDTGMLNPKKSLLAIFGITNRLDHFQNLSSHDSL